MAPVPARAPSASSSSARLYDRHADRDTTGAARSPRTSHSVPASPIAANTIDALWKKIEDHRRTASDTTIHFSEDAVATNHTKVLCPNNDETLQVRLGAPGSALTPIHANYVPLSTTGRYAVGQSPGGDFSAACARDLIHSLDSGRGLFQFTSRTAHRVTIGIDDQSATATHHEKSLSTVASMLEAARKSNNGIWPKLGERYQVTQFEVVPSDPPQRDITRYRLIACDLTTHQSETVFITQAGLRFIDKRLRSEEIARAAELFTAHRDETPVALADNAPVQTGPLICSAAGIGRAAVLAVYQDLCSRMPVEVNESNLDAQLEEAIKRGIDTRGPKFLYSREQVEELRKALVNKMRNVQGAPSADQSARRNLQMQLERRSVNPPNEVNIDSDRDPVPDLPSGEFSPILPGGAEQFHPESAFPEQAIRRDEADEVADVDDLPVQFCRISPQPSNDTAAATAISAATPTIFAAAGVATAINIHSDSTSSAERHTGAAAAQPFDGIHDTSREDGARIPNSVRKNVRFVSDLAPADNRSHLAGRAYRQPIELYNACCRELAKADKNHEKLITFPPQFIWSDATEEADPDSRPAASAAALVIATTEQFRRNSARSLTSFALGFKSDAQKQVIANLYDRVETLTSHRVFQALLRPFTESQPQATPHTHFFDRKQVAVFAPPQLDDAVSNCDVVGAPLGEPDGVLNGVPFAPWQAVPTSARGWNRDATAIDEPAPLNDCHAVGVVIVEPDGRAWIVAPTNQRGGKRNTFPTGSLTENPGMSLQACARKVAFEKSGLQIELTRQLIDMSNEFGTTRYYLAERIGGTPADAGWKSQAVCLVPTKALRTIFNDDRNFKYGRERDVMKAMQWSMLYAQLSGSEKLADSIPKLREWIAAFASNVQVDSRAIDDRLNPYVISFNQSAARVSHHINAIVMPWRVDNCELVGDSNTRLRRAGLHAATILKTPAGSVMRTLHANYIPLKNSRTTFIAAQRPYTLPAPAAKTGIARGIAHALRNQLIESPQTQTQAPAPAPSQSDNSIAFWQTVVKEKVNLIVDLDDVKAKPKALAYGPTEAGQSRNIGTHTLTLDRAQKDGKLHKEALFITDATNTLQAGITRLHYTAWPENDAITPEALIELAHEIGLYCTQRGTKVLIHSAHGAGRTGTLMAFIAASEQLANILPQQKMMSPEVLIKIVMDIVVRGRIERGSQFVGESQMGLLLAALLKKHFVRFEPTDDMGNGVLISII